MPGDFGLDPLSLGQDPNALAWYRQAELQHARWAMVGVAGSVAAEAVTGVNFYTAPLEVDLPMNPAALLAFQFLMMHWVEIRRWMDIRTPGSANQDPIFENQKLTTVDPGYPGGPFDPFGFSKGDLDAAKTRELYFGRLAMWAFMGGAWRGLCRAAPRRAEAVEFAARPGACVEMPSGIARRMRDEARPARSARASPADPPTNQPSTIQCAPFLPFSLPHNHRGCRLPGHWPRTAGGA